MLSFICEVIEQTNEANFMFWAVFTLYTPTVAYSVFHDLRRRWQSWLGAQFMYVSTVFNCRYLFINQIMFLFVFKGISIESLNRLQSLSFSSVFCGVP